MTQQTNITTRVQSTLGHMTKQFKSMLPIHIAPEKFLRAAVTAVQNSPDIQQADHDSIISACQKAAQDGLIIDNREAAIVVFNTKQGNQWVKKAQYMPMVAGILKKARNSGDISTITAKAVYENDSWDYWVDESGEHFNYRPTDDDNPGAFKLAFAVAKLKDGSVQIEVVRKSKIEKIRKSSKAGNDDKGDPKGIWKQWYDEMAVKTALKQLCKFLPSSSDLDDMIRYDNDSFGIDAPDQPATEPAKRKSKTVAESVILGESENITESEDPTPTEDDII